LNDKLAALFLILFEPHHAKQDGQISFEAKRSMGGSIATSLKSTYMTFHSLYILILDFQHRDSLHKNEKTGENHGTKVMLYGNN